MDLKWQKLISVEHKHKNAETYVWTNQQLMRYYSENGLHSEDGVKDASRSLSLKRKHSFRV
jgi:hypothetical protein